jgi:hypothetical protein
MFPSIAVAVKLKLVGDGTVTALRTQPDIVPQWFTLLVATD